MTHSATSLPLAVSAVSYHPRRAVYRGRITAPGLQLNVTAPGHPSWSHAQIVDHLIEAGARYVRQQMQT